jgi:heterogeneous nuclear ribonucleoprotein R
VYVAISTFHAASDHSRTVTRAPLSDTSLCLSLSNLLLPSPSIPTRELTAGRLIVSSPPQEAEDEIVFEEEAGLEEVEAGLEEEKAGIGTEEDEPAMEEDAAVKEEEEEEEEVMHEEAEPVMQGTEPETEPAEPDMGEDTPADADADAAAEEPAPVPEPEEEEEEEEDILVIDPNDELMQKPAHSCELFVGGIPKPASEEDVNTFCCAEGLPSPTVVQLVMDTASGKNRGYAFVTYASREDAAAACKALHETELQAWPYK